MEWIYVGCNNRIYKNSLKRRKILWADYRGGATGNLELLKQIEELKETLTEKFDLTYKVIYGTNCEIHYNSIDAFLKIISRNADISPGNIDTNVIAKLPDNVKISCTTSTIAILTSAWVPIDTGYLGMKTEFGADIFIRCYNSRTNVVVSDYIQIPIGHLTIQ